ncbi:hypothetical protein EVAR_67643_1 [Eumeta japonica]|uniref:Uncharacterized protein n=1 Tax=Eumeta variegata TaxID=151549 RepID=A0A4C1ZA96_EUMVA|nr:hypothetical protein EVAR_67643_1 [Eumeta japonica]
MRPQVRVASSDRMSSVATTTFQKFTPLGVSSICRGTRRARRDARGARGAGRAAVTRAQEVGGTVNTQTAYELRMERETNTPPVTYGEPAKQQMRSDAVSFGFNYLPHRNEGPWAAPAPEPPSSGVLHPALFPDMFSFYFRRRRQEAFEAKPIYICKCLRRATLRALSICRGITTAQEKRDCDAAAMDS